MFIVKGIHEGTCIACGKETEAFDVECQQKTVIGLLCPKCFTRQVKMRSRPKESKQLTPPVPAMPQ